MKFSQYLCFLKTLEGPSRRKYCKNFHEISVTLLHLGEAGPVACDLAKQPVVARGALDDAVIVRAAADLSRPLQHEILVCVLCFVEDM